MNRQRGPIHRRRPPLHLRLLHQTAAHEQNRQQENDEPLVQRDVVFDAAEVQDVEGVIVDVQVVVHPRGTVGEVSLGIGECGVGRGGAYVGDGGWGARAATRGDDISGAWVVVVL